MESTGPPYTQQEAQSSSGEEHESLSPILTQATTTTLRSEIRDPHHESDPHRHNLTLEQDGSETSNGVSDNVLRKEDLFAENQRLRKEIEEMKRKEKKKKKDKRKEKKGGKGKGKAKSSRSKTSALKGKAKRGRSHSRRRHPSRSRSASRSPQGRAPPPPSPSPPRSPIPSDQSGSTSPSQSGAGSDTESSDPSESSSSSDSQHHRHGHRYREHFAVSNVKLENFSGSEEEDAEAWLIRAERILRAGTRRKSRYVGFLSLRLRGNASTWYDHLPSRVIKSYTLFRKNFLDTFQRESTATHGGTLRALEKVKQGPREFLASYHIRFVKGVADLKRFDNIGNVAAVHRYISGLRKEYQGKAAWYQKKNEHLTIKVLHKKMLIWELHSREQQRKGHGFFAVPSPTTQTPTQKPATTSVGNELAALRKELQDLRNQVKRGGRPQTPPWIPQWTEDGQPICSFCKGVGHMRKVCPQRKNSRPTTTTRNNRLWCDFHKAFGHSTDECRAKKYEEAKTATTNAVPQLAPFLCLPAPGAQERNADQPNPDPAAQQRGFQQPAQE